jgi:phage portal protein BeeE
MTMAHRDRLHQARPIRVLVYQHRCNDWPLMTRLSIMARTIHVHLEAGYTTAPEPLCALSHRSLV